MDKRYAAPACNEPGQQLNVEGTVANAVDGATRLLGDVERFGFRVSALRLQANDDAAAKISMTIVIPAGSDPQQVLSRFMRHRAVLSLAFTAVS